MPDTNKRTAKTGVAHYALEEESENQRRGPPRGMTKEEMNATSQPVKDIGAQTEALTGSEEPTMSRQGAKGGKSSGSRAGLTSSSKKNSRT